MKLISFIQCSAFEGYLPSSPHYYWYSRKKDLILNAEQIVCDFDCYRADELIMLPSFETENIAKCFLHTEGYGYLIDYIDNVANLSYRNFCIEFRRFLEVSTSKCIKELEERWKNYFYERGAAMIMNWIEEHHIPYEL